MISASILVPSLRGDDVQLLRTVALTYALNVFPRVARARRSRGRRTRLLSIVRSGRGRVMSASIAAAMSRGGS
jgi:hypothetical protein